MVHLHSLNRQLEDQDILIWLKSIFTIDETEVPENPFSYMRKAFKDTSFRASQYKMIYNLMYGLKFESELVEIWDLKDLLETIF